MTPGLPLILIAEDNQTDMFFLKRLIEKDGWMNPVVFVSDGQEVVDYLSGFPPYDNRWAYPLPGLIILDIKMPRMDGFAVLEWISTKPGLGQIPVVALSSSPLDTDILKARQLGARDYVVKPPRLLAFEEEVRSLRERWLSDPSRER